MQLYRVRWLSQPSGLWTLSDEEFAEEIARKAVRLARKSSILIGMFDLENDILSSLVLGSENSVHRFILKLETQIEESLRRIRLEYSDKASAGIYCISQIPGGDMEQELKYRIN